MTDVISYFSVLHWTALRNDFKRCRRSRNVAVLKSGDSQCLNSCFVRGKVRGGSYMIAKQAIPVSDIHVGDRLEFVFLGLFGGSVAAEQFQGAVA